ncbi:MAG: metal-dependent hydrolase [Verrucomicrobia bacterium]|nr:metal-dependent hydrolase [Verrucomicrobiota bacterium]
MPSPVAHSLIGLAIGAGWLVPRGRLREVAAHAWRLRGPLLLCILAANAPDLDFLPGIAIGNLNAFHQTYSHSLSFAAAFALLLAWLYRRWPARRAWAWLFLLVCSHLVADLFSVDTRPPIGIAALWPFTSETFIAPFSIFQPLRKAEWADIIQWHNARAGLLEMACCLPPVLAVWFWKARRSSAADLLSTHSPHR